MKTATPNLMLLVEDNPDDVFAFERALKKAHVQNPLRTLTDGRAALQYLKGEGDYANRAAHPLPFIIFLDLKLPYHSGFEILKWIRQQTTLDRIPVIVLTSSAEIKDQQQAYALGARTYLVKPPNPQDISDIIESLTTFWASKPFHISPGK